MSVEKLPEVFRDLLVRNAMYHLGASGVFAVEALAADCCEVTITAFDQWLVYASKMIDGAMAEPGIKLGIEQEAIRFGFNSIKTTDRYKAMRLLQDGVELGITAMRGEHISPIPTEVLKKIEHDLRIFTKGAATSFSDDFETARSRSLMNAAPAMRGT